MDAIGRDIFITSTVACPLLLMLRRFFPRRLFCFWRRETRISRDGETFDGEAFDGVAGSGSKRSSAK